MIAIPDTILNLDSFQPHIINISLIPSALFMFISIVNKFDMDRSKSHSFLHIFFNKQDKKSCKFQ